MQFWLGIPYLILFLLFKVIFKVKGVNFKVKYEKISFLTNKARNVCNTSFYGILTDKSNYSIIWLIKGFL